MHVPINSDESVKANQPTNLDPQSDAPLRRKNKIKRNSVHAQTGSADLPTDKPKPSERQTTNQESRETITEKPGKRKDFREDRKKHKEEQKDASVAASRPTCKTRSGNAARQMKRKLLSCIKCCKERKSIKTGRGRGKISFLGHQKKRSETIKEGKGVRSEDSSGSSIVPAREPVERISKKKHGEWYKKQKKSERSATIPVSDKWKRTRAKKPGRKERPEVAGVSAFDVDAQLVAPDENLMKDHVRGKEFLDFTKSCCYLCAQNTMAIATAISSMPEKSDGCAQVSTHQFFRKTQTTDKSCTPAIDVTVQSRVKVKTRDACTLCPEITKRKATKPKSKLKKFNLFPKVKHAKAPTARTVACETERLIKCNNKGRCGVGNEEHCRKVHK